MPVSKFLNLMWYLFLFKTKVFFKDTAILNDITDDVDNIIINDTNLVGMYQKQTFVHSGSGTIR